MCGLGKMGEIYVTPVKEKDGFRVFYSLTPKEAKETLRKLKIVDAKNKTNTVINDIFFAKGNKHRDMIHRLNAENRLLGVNYKIWGPLKKAGAHYRIWKYIFLNYLSKKLKNRIHPKLSCTCN